MHLFLTKTHQKSLILFFILKTEKKKRWVLYFRKKEKGMEFYLKYTVLVISLLLSACFVY